MPHKTARKPPGVRAKMRGTTLKRGAATQVMIYPRPKEKALIVQGARLAGVSVSSFAVRCTLKETAYLMGRQLEDIVPADRLQLYV